MTEKAQDSINIIHKFGIANLNAKKPLTVNNKYNRTPISSKFFRFPESSLRDNITKHMKEYSMTLDTLLSVKAEQFTKYNPKKKDVIKARVDYFRLQVLELFFGYKFATLSLDLQRIVNTLRRMKTGDPIPPALKPFVEDVELDAQIQQLERIKQKRIKREQRMLAKKLKNVIALDGDGIDEEKIKGVMDGFLLEQLRKEANKENALPVVYKQRNDRSKRRRMNTSNDNL
eukprot:476628_1